MVGVSLAGTLRRVAPGRIARVALLAASCAEFDAFANG